MKSLTDKLNNLENKARLATLDEFFEQTASRRSLVSNLKANLNGIGIEREAEYVEIIERRVEVA